MAGAIVLLAVQFIYIHTDLGMTSSAFRLFFPLHVLNVIAAASVAGLMMWPDARSWWRTVALVGTTVIAANGTYANLITHDPLTQLLSMTVVAIGTAAMLPWGGWWQLAMNAVCLTSFTTVAIGTSGIAAIDPHYWAVMLGAGAVAQFSAVFAEQTRRELMLRDDKTRTLIENASDAIMMVDERDVILDWNPRATAMFGWTREQATGKRLSDLIIPQEYREEHLARLRQVGDGAASRGMPAERSAISSDGRRFPVEIAISPIRTNDSLIFGVFVHDTSGRKRADESRVLLASIVESSSDAIFSTTLDRRVSSWNPGAERMFGYTAAEIIGKPVDLLLPEGGGTELREAAARISSGQGVQQYETVRRRKSGSTVEVSVTASPIRDYGGVLRGIAIIARDITARVRVEHQLAETAAKFREIFHQSLDPVSIQRASDLVYVDVNDAFLHSTGYTREQVIGRNLFEIGMLNNPNDATAIATDIARNGSVQNLEIDFRRADGVAVPSLFSASFIKVGGEKCILATARIITDRKRAEQQLIEASESALAATRAKSAFLAGMSHEIRTPLNAMLGMVDLMSETELSVEQREYVRIFRSTGDSLRRLIDNILDLSRIESGRLTLESSAFDLRETVEGTVETLAGRAHEKGIELICDISSEIGTEVVGDALRLRQVLLNILGNALKFTERGQISVRVSNADDAVAPDMLHFSISDTGIGIAPEKQREIFEEFTQADSSITRRFGGSGLGLAISHHIVGLMRGKIWVESEPGRGSTFHFLLHFAPQKQRGSALFSARLANRRVLLVDDNPSSRAAIRNLLEAERASVVEVGDGESALELLSSAEISGAIFDAVLLDARMPRMDGFEAIRRMRQRGVARRSAIILMVNADALTADVARSREFDVAGCVVKPVKRSDLIDALLDLKGNKSAPPRREQPQPDVRRRALRILLAEDSDDNRVLIRTYLRKTPYTLDIAENGHSAVEKFRTGSYDVVLMDMQMPVMDGYTAVREIRAIEREQRRAHTPVLALTAYAFREDAQKTRDAGCDAHLAKPIRKVTLLAHIDRYATEPSGDDTPELSSRLDRSRRLKSIPPAAS